MYFLPGFVICVLLKTCLGASTEALSESSNQIPKCPGKCIEITACTDTLNETDCEGELVCCLDDLESTSMTELDAMDSSQSVLEDNTGINVEINDDFAGQMADETYQTYVEDQEDTSGGFTYVYSEDMESDSQTVEKVEQSCPGLCVMPDDIGGCDYVVSTGMCHEKMTCCLTEMDVEDMKQPYEIAEEPHYIAKRQSNIEEYSEVGSCPGSCVHPSHSMFCEEILPDFVCPLNALCCKKRPSARSLSSSMAPKCSGQCLPPHLQGYCFPPNELTLGPTNCPRGTACCSRRPSGSVAKPPTVTRMTHPGFAMNQSPVTSEVLGHLAIDDAGTVFKVTNNGQVTPLPKLTHFDHLRSTFTKQMSYPRLDGEIVIYSDDVGILYQQFLPRSKLPEAQTELLNPSKRQPINQFNPQASLQSGVFHESEDMQKEEPQESDPMEDVVIPDDDDEAPVPKTPSPVVREDKSPRPACPGSCMSYFLRFTCFRGYAIYDGFTCPGRSVCCAKLQDIESHEEYLKSLSPYYNSQQTSRDQPTPRCGVKGTRDTPRIMGGKESLPGEWCWQVAIINIQNQYICGGALIDDSWILTAAHCVAVPLRENQALFVRVGVTDLKSTEDNKKGQTVRVLSTYVHHNYNSQNLDNNIALIRLKKPVELNSNVCVICLPTRGQMPEENARCTVTGYGFVSPGGDISLRVREAEVPIIDDMECMSNVTEALTNPFIIPSSSFCAGGQGQSDACQGDAGGPLACEINGFHEIVGLVSWGLGCGRADVPSIYVKVPSFMGWINQIISSSSFLLSLN